MPSEDPDSKPNSPSPEPPPFKHSEGHEYKLKLLSKKITEKKLSGGPGLRLISHMKELHSEGPGSRKKPKLTSNSNKKL